MDDQYYDYHYATDSYVKDKNALKAMTLCGLTFPDFVGEAVILIHDYWDDSRSYLTCDACVLLLMVKDSNENTRTSKM